MELFRLKLIPAPFAIKDPIIKNSRPQGKDILGTSIYRFKDTDIFGWYCKGKAYGYPSGLLYYIPRKKWEKWEKEYNKTINRGVKNGKK